MGFESGRMWNGGGVSAATGSDVRLLFVTSPTSGPARRMESVVASLQTRNRHRVSIRRIDAEAESDLVTRLGVREIPTLLFVQDRREELRLEGRATLEEIERALEECT
jgi:thioredoxin-like negative regulator of GroEL